MYRKGGIPRPEHTTRPALVRSLPPLLRELGQLLAAHRPAVRQGRVFDRLRGLVLGQVCVRVRHTLSQALLALSIVA